jgi:hypothetical protein
VHDFLFALDVHNTRACETVFVSRSSGRKSLCYHTSGVTLIYRRHILSVLGALCTTTLGNSAVAHRLVLLFRADNPSAVKVGCSQPGPAVSVNSAPLWAQILENHPASMAKIGIRLCRKETSQKVSASGAGQLWSFCTGSCMDASSGLAARFEGGAD